MNDIRTAIAPPSDIEAQKALVVLALETPELLGDSLAIAPPDTWYGASWVSIARAIMSCVERGIAVNVSNVGRAAREANPRGLLTHVIETLAGLAGHPYYAGATIHATAIREAYVRRERILLEESRIAALRDSGMSVASINEAHDARLVDLVTVPASRFGDTLGAREIFARLPPIPWVIQGLDLCPGAPALLAGYGFSGKSIAAQSLLLSVASGLPVWGAYAAQQGKAIHLDYEQGEHLTRLRYQRLAYASGIAPQDLDGQLELACFPSLRIDQIEAENELSSRCLGAKVCLIDSFRAACATVEENSSEARVPLDMLGRVSAKTGCIFLVIHHARKPSVDSIVGARDAIRGSSALYDACSSVFVLEGSPGSDDRTLYHVKARTSGRCVDPLTLTISEVGDDGSPGALAASWSAPGLSVGVSAAPTSDARQVASERARVASLRDEVLGLLGQGPVTGSVETIAGMIGRKKTGVCECVRALVAEGEILITGPKTGAKTFRLYSPEE
jgi:hypothetical protein